MLSHIKKSLNSIQNKGKDWNRSNLNIFQFFAVIILVSFEDKEYKK